MTPLLLAIGYVITPPVAALAIGFVAEGMNGLRGVLRALDWR